MSWARAFGVAVAALLFQCLAAPAYRVYGAAPQFALLVVGFIACRAEPRQAIVTAVLTGLCFDLVSLDPWGTYLLAMPAAALVASMRRTASGRPRPILDVTRIVIGTLTALLLRAMVYSIHAGVLPRLDQEAATVLGTLVYAIPSLFLLERCERLVCGRSRLRERYP